MQRLYCHTGAGQGRCLRWVVGSRQCWLDMERIKKMKMEGFKMERIKILHLQRMVRKVRHKWRQGNRLFLPMLSKTLLVIT